MPAHRNQELTETGLQLERANRARGRNRRGLRQPIAQITRRNKGCRSVEREEMNLGCSCEPEDSRNGERSGPRAT